MTKAGFDIRPGIHPIVPVMLGDAKLAQEMARDLLDEGIYVDRLLLPGRAQGPGAHPRAALGGAQPEHVDAPSRRSPRSASRLGVVR